MENSFFIYFLLLMEGLDTRASKNQTNCTKIGRQKERREDGLIDTTRYAKMRQVDHLHITEKVTDQ